MSEKPKRTVGYKCPPEETQFKKGEPSANPKGRPRKNKAFQQLLQEQLNRKVTITQNGRRRRVTINEVILQQLAKKAAEGDLAAIRDIIKLNQSIAPLKPEPEMSPEELKLRQERAQRLSALLIESLERKAAENKPERPRPPPKPPEDGGESEDK